MCSSQDTVQKPVAEEAAKVAGVEKVLLADAPRLAEGLAEPVEATLVDLGKDYSHILAPATAYGEKHCAARCSPAGCRSNQ
ncbi:hypothetical protein NK8_83840 (plasmid) [Caballeronia sp. NK8]|nr:hypothetical protein NK8_83840 [Caballeronia sp. NK8]